MSLVVAERMGGAPASPPSPDPPLVRVTDLWKQFPIVRSLADVLRRSVGTLPSPAIADVSLDVHAGEFLGLLGPNGAGKTTLLKILATLVLPDDGSASVAGHDVRSDGAAVRDAVSLCLASERSLFLRLSAAENLRVATDLAGIPVADVAGRIAESLD